jgi:hypothetical protein
LNAVDRIKSEKAGKPGAEKTEYSDHPDQVFARELTPSPVVFRAGPRPLPIVDFVLYLGPSSFVRFQRKLALKLGYSRSGKFRTPG